MTLEMFEDNRRGGKRLRGLCHSLDLTLDISAGYFHKEGGLRERTTKARIEARKRGG